MNKNEIVIEFSDVCLKFGQKEVLKNLSFKVYRGEIVSIAGPSGSGKSTILKIISGLLKPGCGRVVVNSDKVGMAFQYPALFNSMSVGDNVALGLKETTDLNNGEIQQKVEEALRMVNLANTEEMFPGELSGGMQKRVSIARTLVLEPEIILYDEPSTGLDPATASKLEDDMIRLRNEINVTSVVVTHVTETLIKVSDRILILDEGRIVWEGSKEAFLTENTKYPYSFRERKPLSDFE